MNNPFDYEPSHQMLAAQQLLVAKIESLCAEDDTFDREVSKGKMFGILLTRNADGVEETLFAFSGQIEGMFVMPGFVPPVFDYLDPEGYFKVHEREISSMNARISALEGSEELKALRTELISLRQRSEQDIADYKTLMQQAKAERDIARSRGTADVDSLVRESQFMKAELKRKKNAWNAEIGSLEAKMRGFTEEIGRLKLERHRKSDSLQRWLFEQFVFCNYKGETRSLFSIFNDWTLKMQPKVAEAFSSMPPSGSGECCEPKLLDYAFRHGLTPLEIGMFWWGESPKQEIRHHLHFYPACSGKCRPILDFMLPTEETDDGSKDDDGATLPIIYEDESMIVVNKPAGMLSVPGKSDKANVFSILRNRLPDCKELMMVHRLDMDTSGLLVVAKSKAVHKELQRQFEERTTRKVYVALLENELEGRGEITLKLRPDIHDRPRQMVDDVYGKESLTEYVSLGDNRVELRPHTGRTHQLRVHCAHHDGLGNPIKGDRLYGHRAGRLYLHAATLEINHPVTGERMVFHAEPEY